MARPSQYSDEFKKDAVALYRASDRRSIKAVADRIGLNHETSRQWIRADDEAGAGSGTACALSVDERGELQQLHRAEREWF